MARNDVRRCARCKRYMFRIVVDEESCSEVWDCRCGVQCRVRQEWDKLESVEWMGIGESVEVAGEK